MKRRLVLLVVAVVLFSCNREAPAVKGGRVTQAAALSTKVVIRITGLCTFTDAEVESTDGKPVPMMLHLINANHGSTPHLPVLLVHKKYFGSSLQDTRGLLAKGDYRYLQFIGEELFFPGLEGNDLSYTRDPVSCANTSSKSLGWTPRLRDIVPDIPQGPVTHAHLDGRYLYKIPNPKRIAAYTEVAHGILEANLRSPVIWEFKTAKGANDGTLRQPIAQEILWKFTIPDDKLIINSKAFEPVGSVERPLLRLNAVDGKIEFTIANVVAGDIDVMVNGTTTLAEEQDEHFLHYYSFLSDQTVKKRIPVAWGVCKNNQISNNPCDIAKFVKLTPAPTCSTPTNFGTAGGLNCGPDGQP